MGTAPIRGQWPACPTGRLGLCTSEKGSLFHFEVAGQGIDAMSLIWPESCPLGDSPTAGVLPRNAPLPGADVWPREPLRPEQQGYPAPGPACPSPTRGSGYRWGAGERAKSLQPPPQRPSLLWRWGLGLSSTEAGQDSAVLFIGFIWRWEVTWGGVHESTRQSGELSHQWLPFGRVDDDRKQTYHVLLGALGRKAALTDGERRRKMLWVARSLG